MIPPQKRISVRTRGKAPSHWREKPQNMMIVNNPKKPGPSGDARGEGESSTPESQDPTDGSYILDMESCNI